MGRQKKSFEFKNDENGEYITLSHDTQQKNFQGGIRSAEAPSDKRMYADDTECCPVKMLKLLLEKTPLMPHHCSTSMIKLPWPFQKELFGSHPSHYPNAPFRIFYLKFAKMLVLKRGTRHTASAPQLFNILMTRDGKHVILCFYQATETNLHYDPTAGLSQLLKTEP